MPLRNPCRAFLRRALRPFLDLIEPDAMLYRRLLDGDRELDHRAGLRDHGVIPEFGHGEGYRFIERFGLKMGRVSDRVSVGKGDAAAGEHSGIINRLSLFLRRLKFRSAIRSTNLLFLYVLQVLRQSSRTCKLL